MKLAGDLSRLYWTAFTLAEAVRCGRLPYRSTAQLQRLQNRRVRRIVAHAYANVPFYRQAMDERSLQPSNFKTADDLALLPLITSADLAVDPDRFRSCQIENEPLLEIHTSGTSGHIKHVTWDRAAVFRARAAGLRRRSVLHEVLGKHRSVRQLTVARPGGTSTDIRAFHQRHAWLPVGLETPPQMIDPKQSFERNLALINQVQPNLIRGFGAYIGAIYRWAWVNEKDIAVPRLIYHGGEQLGQADQQLLEREYGITVLTAYQACEALRIAWQCPRGHGLHIDVDHVAIRIADKNGQTAESGERGQVVLSNLTNHATVLLNYAIGDLGSISTNLCPCGRNLPLLDRLEGRADDLVRLPDGEVAHESVVLSHLYGVPGVTRLQLIQESLKRFTLRVIYGGHEDNNALRQCLTETLIMALGGGPFEVTVEIVDQLPAEKSGKFRSIICKVPLAAMEVAPLQPQEF